MSTPSVVIGTRGSPLALAQANEVRQLLIAAHPALSGPDAIEIRVITTTGDTVTDRTLAAIGGKGLFTKEIETALADGAIDLAVHSMKDVPTVLPEGLVIDCILPREDPRDAFFSVTGSSLDDLPPDAVVGTASLRRQAQILHRRPDLRVVPFRGNVETRLRKLESGIVDATLLAVAGLNRLGQSQRIQQILDTALMLPSVAQGAIGIERREADTRVAELLAPLSDRETTFCVAAERALLMQLDGSCRTPIGGLAILTHDRLSLTGLVALPDGSVLHRVTETAPPEEAKMLGTKVAEALRVLAGPGFFSAAGLDLPTL